MCLPSYLTAESLYIWKFSEKALLSQLWPSKFSWSFFSFLNGIFNSLMLYLVAQVYVCFLNMFGMYICVVWLAISCHPPLRYATCLCLCITGVVSPFSGTKNQPEYYSTFHSVRNRKKFTKKEWDDFTRESTQQAISEWASSPEFSNWMIENADRIQLLPSESSDETMASGSDSTDEIVAGSSRQFSFFNW